MILELREVPGILLERRGCSHLRTLILEKAQQFHISMFVPHESYSGHGRERELESFIINLKSDGMSYTHTNLQSVAALVVGTPFALVSLCSRLIFRI
ncbi:hypothetical protein Leryth_016956 [Lithospermum erythrorhizon]|nr:hypothetical protein Leryth_016956 [Lithospermum erythrorhizon]